MARWIACGAVFIIGDVIRWTEPVWIEKGKRKKKLVKVGLRRVTGQVVTADAKGFASVSVMQCDILANLAARVLEPYKKGDIIRRKRGTIGKGSGERLEWTEEGARALAMSKFLA